MDNTAKITIGKTYDLNIIQGTEAELALDISSLRKLSKFITFDDGYGNTGSCESSVTFIDGDKGILRYRGYDIANLAENSNFLETSYLVMYGELPTSTELEIFMSIDRLFKLPSEVTQAIKALPQSTHPMGVLASGLQA